MHGGEVNVTSEGIGYGSTFCISLPKVAAPAKTPKAVDSKKMPIKRVLLVDDNKDAADTMAELLMLLGHQTTTAYTALEALEYIDSFDPEIVLLDIGLPDMTGYQLAEKIIAKSTKKPRVLAALTGYGQAEDVRKAKNAGFSFHFTKPVTIEDLNEVFSSSCSQSQLK
jgi:CheY-like chemotaxis protein